MSVLNCSKTQGVALVSVLCVFEEMSFSPWRVYDVSDVYIDLALICMRLGMVWMP